MKQYKCSVVYDEDEGMYDVQVNGYSLIMLHDEESAKALSHFINLRSDVFDAITSLHLTGLTLTNFVTEEVWKARKKEAEHEKAGEQHTKSD
jgi:hypothetical protein